VTQRSRRTLLAFVPILALALLFLLLPPDGHDRAPWLQFFGRFHLLTVHFPIALILLIPIFELAGRHPRHRHLLASIDVLLALSGLGSLAAAALGWSLARSSGYSGRLVTQHMWAGLAVAAACALCYALRPRPGFAYPIALTITVALVSFTGYRGGQLSQGENHLTEAMPPSLRRLIGLSANQAPLPKADPATFYGASIEPIFTASCISCHGPDKQKGELRLDTYAALMRGGKHGLVIKPGDTKASELFRRITLPRDDNKAMPPQAKTALTPAQIKLIELWIAAGASSTLPANGIKDAPTHTIAPAAEITFPDLDPDAVTRLRAPLAPTFEDLNKRLPNVLQYESRTTAGIVIDATPSGAKFTDESLAMLKPLAAQIVTADLSGTAITDRSAATLAALTQLRTLRLMHTRITDATLLKLSPLTQLESLNLYATPITPASLPTLEHLPKLQHAYVGETKITPTTPIPETIKPKLQF
jgi:mono/diheme cytochrome c family protein